MHDATSWDVDDNLIAEVGKLMAGDSTDARLPRHRHGLGSEQVLLVQRARILVATAEVVAEVGYPDATTREIMTRAGVSSKTFYLLYPDKAAAFWDAYTLMDGVIVGQLRSLTLSSVSIEALRSAVHDFLGFLHTVPLMTRLHIEHGRAAGSRILDRHAAIMNEFVTSLQRLLDEAKQQDPNVQVPSRAVVSAVVGGISETVFQHVRVSGIEGVDSLEDPIVELVARVFVPHLWTN